MEKKKLFAGLLVILLLGIALLGCTKSKKCTNPDKPYYCSEAKGCCAYRYNDNHGTCWSTMEGCRSSGYACSTCHEED